MSGRTLAADGGSIDLSAANVSYVVVVAAIALVALGFAVALRKSVLAAPQGTEKMQGIAAAVQEGATAFLTRPVPHAGLVRRPRADPAEPAAGRHRRHPFRPLPVLRDRSAVLLGHRLPGHGSGHPSQPAGRRCRPRAQRRGERRQDRLPHRRRRRLHDRGPRPARSRNGRGHLPGRRPTVLEGFGFGAALLAMFIRVGGGIAPRRPTSAPTLSARSNRAFRGRPAQRRNDR